MSKKNKKQYQQPSVKHSVKHSQVDIVIPVKGQFDFLSKCLESIPNAVSVPYKVIIIDNASDKEQADDFYVSLRGKPEYQIIRKSENLGFPRACNIAASHGFSPLIFLLNSDVVLGQNSIDFMIESLLAQEIGAVGMKLVFPQETNRPDRPSGKIQHVGLATNVKGNIIHIFSGWSPDNPRVLSTKEVYAVTGAALMTKRTIWNRVGGFLQDYGLGTWEDVDYCLSIRELGYSVLVDQRAVGTHYTGATALGLNIAYPLELNRLIFLRRWAEKLKYTEWLHV